MGHVGQKGQMADGRLAHFANVCVEISLCLLITSLFDMFLNQHTCILQENALFLPCNLGSSRHNYVNSPRNHLNG